MFGDLNKGPILETVFAGWGPAGDSSPRSRVAGLVSSPMSAKFPSNRNVVLSEEKRFGGSRRKKRGLVGMKSPLFSESGVGPLRHPNSKIRVERSTRIGPDLSRYSPSSNSSYTDVVSFCLYRKLNSH